MHKRKKPKEYYSVFDLQLEKFINTGLNSPSLQEAVEDTWDYWSMGSDLTAKEMEKMDKWDWKDKKEFLEYQEFRFEKHKGKLESQDDW